MGAAPEASQAESDNSDGDRVGSRSRLLHQGGEARRRTQAGQERIFLRHQVVVDEAAGNGRFDPAQAGVDVARQRVALARAFVGRPRILFADEPTGNLDQATGQHVSELLFELNHRSGTTLVLVTHDLSLARRCRHVYRLDGGRLHPVPAQAGNAA